MAAISYTYAGDTCTIDGTGACSWDAMYDQAVIDGWDAQIVEVVPSVSGVGGVYYVLCSVVQGGGTEVSTFTSQNEMIYFEAGQTYQIKDNSILNMCQMSGSQGIDGSVWSFGPGATMNIIVSGDSDAEYNQYAGRVIIRTDKNVGLQDGILRFGKAEIGYSLSSGTNRRIYIDGDTLEIMDLSIKQAYAVYFLATPSYCHNLHLHDVTEGLSASVNNLVLENVTFSGTYTNDSQTSSNITNMTVHNPSKPLDSVAIFTADKYMNERYPLDIHTTDSDGDDLDSVNVICDRANIVTGADGNEYRCIAPISYSVDATHKPHTGTDYLDFFEQITDSGVIGGDWRTGSFYMSDERVFGNVATGNKGIKLDQSDTQYIDLNTSAGYLNGLRADKLAVISFFYPSIYTSGDVIWSAEGNDDANYPKLYLSAANTMRLRWNGTSGLILDSVVKMADVKYSATMVGDGTSGWFSLNGGAVSTDAYGTLDLADAGKIRVGSNADAADAEATATFGPFFILNLSGVGTVDATFAQKLANAVHVAAKENDYSASAIRTAIMAVDGAIVGTYWGLNGLTDLTAYKVEDGTAKGFDAAAITGTATEELLNLQVLTTDSLEVTGDLCPDVTGTYVNIGPQAAVDAYNPANPEPDVYKCKNKPFIIWRESTGTEYYLISHIDELGSTYPAYRWSRAVTGNTIIGAYTAAGTAAGAATVAAGRSGVMPQQNVVARVMTGTSELEDKFDFNLTFEHASYPDYTQSRIIAGTEMNMELEMAISTADLETAVEDAIDTKLATIVDGVLDEASDGHTTIGTVGGEIFRGK